MQYLVCTKNSAYGVASFLEKEEVLKAFRHICELDPVHHGHLVYRTEGGNKNVVFGNSNQASKRLRYFKAVLTDGVNHWLVQAYNDRSRDVPDSRCWFYNPSPTGILLGMGKAGFTFAAWNVSVGVESLPDLNKIEKVDPQRWTEVVESGIRNDDSTVADAPEEGKKAHDGTSLANGPVKTKKAKTKKQNKEQAPAQVTDKSTTPAADSSAPNPLIESPEETNETVEKVSPEINAVEVPSKSSDRSVVGLMEVN